MGRASGARSGRDTAKLGQDLPKRVYVSRKGEKNTRRQDNAPAGDNQAKSKRHCAAPGERHTTKHRGDVYEMHFMIEASNRGFGVSKPFGDNERYDIILDGGRRLWRVQVKGTECVHQNGFSVRTCWRSSGKRMPYTPEQIDFLAALHTSARTRGQRIWYVIPVRALGGRLGITLYPFGTRADRHPQFEKYREAWKLLGRAKPRK
jgi:hypothetical protein